MTANNRRYWAVLIGLPLLAARELPSAKPETLAVQVTVKASAADSVVEHHGFYSETPCYWLAPPRGESFSGPVASIKSGHYRGVVYMTVQADTLRKQLTNFQLVGARLMDKQKDQELRWYRDGTEPAPTELLLMESKLQRILTARVRLVTSTDANCVMPSNWMLPIKVL